ncbi:MAG: ATP-binding cassette domain-containing protein [Chitinophagales bacterium]|nr:ATP-binding cassette domain-containing protein [Chitinophagales bacterium]
MLRVEKLNTGYDKKQVLFDNSFEISRGEIALLIGSNGSGKSTLLKAIYGITEVWSGKVYFKENEITNTQPSALLQKGICYVPQKNNVFEQLTVKENLEISGLALNNKKLFAERLELVLSKFNTLKEFWNRYPMKMSGGERQQLVLAMAMLHQPQLLLLDEPFTGLSPKAIQRISEQIQAIKQENNTTIIMVEHRIKEALPLANRIIGLKVGNIVQNTTEISIFDDKFFNNILI